MVAKQHGKVVMAKVDIDDHTDLAIEYEVWTGRGLPRGSWFGGCSGHRIAGAGDGCLGDHQVASKGRCLGSSRALRNSEHFAEVTPLSL